MIWWILGIVLALIVGFLGGYVLGAWAAFDEIMSIRERTHILRKPNFPPN